MWNDCIQIHIKVNGIQMPFLLSLAALDFLSYDVPKFAKHPDSRYTTTFRFLVLFTFCLA